MERNTNSILTNIIFTDGTAFSTGTNAFYNGTCYLHENYPNPTFIFATKINSIYSAEWAAVCIALQKATELQLTNVIVILDILAVVNFTNKLLEAGSLDILDTLRANILIKPSHKTAKGFLRLANNFNSLQIAHVKAQTSMHSIWHDGNRKANKLCGLYISLLKGLSHRAEANPDNDQANMVNLPAADIRMIMSKNS